MYRHQILCLIDIIKRTRNIIYTNTNRSNRHDFFITDDRPLVYFVWNKGFIILDELLRASS